MLGKKAPLKKMISQPAKTKMAPQMIKKQPMKKALPMKKTPKQFTPSRRGYSQYA